MRYAVLTLLICSIVAGCATTNLPPVTTGGFVFEDDERRLWLRSEEEQRVLDKSGLIYEDEELEVYLNEIAKKIQPPEIFQDIPCQVKRIEGPHLNSFAYPNGTIYIHAGMLARMENAAQLATLLSHEMTPSTHRHAVRQFRNMKNMTAFLATVRATVGGLGFGIGDLTNLLGTMLSSFASTVLNAM